MFYSHDKVQVSKGDSSLASIPNGLMLWSKNDINITAGRWSFIFNIEIIFLKDDINFDRNPNTDQRFILTARVWEGGGGEV